MESFRDEWGEKQETQESENDRGDTGNHFDGGFEDLPHEGPSNLREIDGSEKAKRRCKEESRRAHEECSLEERPDPPRRSMVRDGIPAVSEKEFGRGDFPEGSQTAEEEEEEDADEEQNGQECSAHQTPLDDVLGQGEPLSNAFEHQCIFARRVEFRCTSSAVMA